MMTGRLVAIHDQADDQLIIADTVSDELVVWSSRPNDRNYLAIFVDRLSLKSRWSRCDTRFGYAVIGVDLEGKKQVLGTWSGAGGSDAIGFWNAVLANLASEGVDDGFYFVCDPIGGIARSGRPRWSVAFARRRIVDLTVPLRGR